MAKTNQNSIYSTVLVNQPAINVQQVLVGAGIAIAIAIAIAIGSVSGVGTTARCYSTLTTAASSHVSQPHSLNSTCVRVPTCT
jgi:hypothetical protein